MTQPQPCYNNQIAIPVTANRFKIDFNAYKIANDQAKDNKQCGSNCNLGNFLAKIFAQMNVRTLQSKVYKQIITVLKTWFSSTQNPYYTNIQYFAATTNNGYIYLPDTGYQLRFLREVSNVLGGTDNDVYRYIANNYFTIQSGYKYKIGTDENTGDNTASAAYNVLISLLPFLIPQIYQVRQLRFTESPRKDFLFSVYNSMYTGSFTNIGTQYSPFNTLRFYNDDDIPSIEYSGRVCMVSTGNLAPIYLSFKIPNGKWLTITIQVNLLPMVPVSLDTNYEVFVSETVYGFKPIYYNTSSKTYQTPEYANYNYKYPSVALIDGYGGDETPVNTYMSNIVTALNFFAPLYYLDFDDTTNKLKIPTIYIKRTSAKPTIFEFEGNIPDKTGWDKMDGMGSFSSDNTLPAIYLTKLNSIPKVDNSDKYRFATFIDDYRVSEQKTTTISLDTTTSRKMEIEIQYRNIYYQKDNIQYPSEEDCAIPFVTYMTIRNWNQNLKTSNNVINFPFANMILATNETNVPLIL